MATEKRTIVVIGAGAGIGLAVSERFGREGYTVALIARNEDNLKKLTAQLSDKGITSAYFMADVLDKNALINALTNIKEKFGTIDVLEFSPLPPWELMRTPLNIDIDNAQFHLNFQLMSAITAVQTVLPEMLERKDGTILFTTAVSAQHPVPLTASFGVAAGALLNYVRLLNQELTKENVFVSIVSIAGILYVGDKPDPEFVNKFPAGVPLIPISKVAETYWRIHTERKEGEVIVTGDEGLKFSL